MIATSPVLCQVETNSDGSTSLKAVRVFGSGTAWAQPRKLFRKDVPPAPVRINKFRRETVSPNYPKDFIFMREISFPPMPGNYSYARLDPHGNQDEILNDVCLKIPFFKYAVVENDGTQGPIVNGRTDSSSCASFLALTGNILVELTWDTGDDFDLSVKTPSGETIDKDNRQVGSGRLVNNNNEDKCDEMLPNGREQAVWNYRDEVPEPGTYTITVRHKTKCAKGVKTNWSLAVIVMGENVSFRKGVSKRPRRDVIEVPFTFP